MKQTSDWQDKLLLWFDTQARDMPWRQTKDPYRIWLSEVMLQQTQVTTVINYYNKFIKYFPTINDLAKADEELVYKLWEGLGYYSRAARLMQCAREIVDKHEGLIPADYAQFLKLPGIGPYTAGAVLSIAYNMKVPAVDGNVFRVITRYFQVYEDIAKIKTRQIIEKIVLESMPHRAGDYNQALMELGATICTPMSPKCKDCPISRNCGANIHDLTKLLPIKTGKNKPTVHKMQVGILQNRNKLFFEKRPPQGLLASLWGLPAVEGENVESLKDYLVDTFDIKVSQFKLLGTVKHVFTHRIWEIWVYEMICDEVCRVESPESIWLLEDETNSISIPTAFKKAIALKRQDN